MAEAMLCSMSVKSKQWHIKVVMYQHKAEDANCLTEHCHAMHHKGGKPVSC